MIGEAQRRGDVAALDQHMQEKVAIDRELRALTAQAG